MCNIILHSHLIYVNNFISLSNDSGWKKQSRCAGSVLSEWGQEHEWMPRYWMSVHGTNGQELYSSFCPMANTPHSRVNTKITWPSRTKIKNTKPNMITSPCLVHLSPQHFICYQKLSLFFSNLISIERASPRW